MTLHQPRAGCEGLFVAKAPGDHRGSGEPSGGGRSPRALDRLQTRGFSGWGLPKWSPIPNSASCRLPHMSMTCSRTGPKVVAGFLGLPFFSNLPWKSQVCIIQGSTGSGKTTQVPQYILDAEADVGTWSEMGRCQVPWKTLEFQTPA